MNLEDNRLSKQLLVIICIIIFLIYLLIGVLLPKQMLPIYEKNIYNYLRQPLEFVDQDVSSIKNQEIGYVYIYDGTIIVSDNFTNLMNGAKTVDVLSKIKEKYGKITLGKNNYYYYTNKSDRITKVSITNDNYIKESQKDAIHNFFPIILITVLFISMILILWSLSIVKKLEFLKKKVEHFDDDTFPHEIKNKYNNASEIKTLELALEDMRLAMKSNEEYKNQMFQNISHDFKTPLTVIKSYIEAIKDEALDSQDGLDVIEEQTLKLENKVHSLLYLNKLDYIKDIKDKMIEKIDIKQIVSSSVEKFKYRRKDLNFILKVDKNINYLGTIDSWETIIDNILNNFLRYAKSEIKIHIKKDKITLYNDGPGVDKNLIDSIFIPYRKGMKGEFGLGLSIVKKTLNYMDYDIQIRNEKKGGVTFIITKN